MQQVVVQARQMARSFDLRIDAGYTIGSVMDELSSENVRFCGRLKKNAVLDRLAEPHLGRPPGRPPKGGYEKVTEIGSHQAESWKKAQRLILVVVDKPDPKTGQLDLLPRYFFLVTNWPKAMRSGEQVLAHYRKRGTFEDRLGEFNQVIGPHLSSREFAENEVTMLLAMWAFNMTTLLRNEFEAAVGGGWPSQLIWQAISAVGVADGWTGGQGRPPFMAPHRTERRFVLEGDDPTDWPTAACVAMESSTGRWPSRLGSAATSLASIASSARLIPRRAVLLPPFFTYPIATSSSGERGLCAHIESATIDPPYRRWATPSGIDLVNNPG